MLDRIADQRIPGFTGRNGDHRAGACVDILSDATRRNLDHRAGKAGITDQHVRAAAENEHWFACGVKVAHHLDQFWLGLDGEHPSCRAPNPQRRVISKYLATR